ncbi:TioE family transcriptional regulator [Dactylosporangium matsuzakiense]|uniref:MerR family transcriptional regulator n=1 Tax=Dactylosporangium matsuzakiense TaxID=53360 RepID=A0A9W6NK45_9ACTN|nr:TioE family transcriptional regulator [Dactylosporangium matsuzakiense]UWZ42517.1 TioE family transcriptional regulator [Dactylosporangium matsuzakiense]GLL00565.1 MerR family transcriptional regulator [Dactylosporangium matsuzakiense]
MLGVKSQRPVDLAREHGISAQSVRNYERDGVLPPAERSASGYRRYTPVHAAALRAFLALVPAHGHAVAGEVLRLVGAGDVDGALRMVDASHAQLLRDRETLDGVAAAVEVLAAPLPPPVAGPLPIGALAHRLGVRPATLRKWERAGILAPERDRATRQRVYGPADVRDAELAHLLRRGGYLLAHIAAVVRQVRDAGGTEALADSLSAWRARLTARGRAMLHGAGRLDEYLGTLAGH